MKNLIICNYYTANNSFLRINIQFQIIMYSMELNKSKNINKFQMHNSTRLFKIIDRFNRNINNDLTQLS